MDNTGRLPDSMLDVKPSTPNAEDLSVLTMLERVKRFEQREVLANEAEEFEDHLDLLNVPREHQGKRLTLLERFNIYNDPHGVVAAHVTSSSPRD